MSDWKPKNREQALGFEMGKSFVQGFTDQIKEKDAEIERLMTRLEQSYAKQTFREWERNVKLIGDMANVLEEEFGPPSERNVDRRPWNLIKRARKVAK